MSCPAMRDAIAGTPDSLTKGEAQRDGGAESDTQPESEINACIGDTERSATEPRPARNDG